MPRKWRRFYFIWVLKKYVKREAMLSIVILMAGQYDTLPHHGNRMLSRPLLREIIREIEVTIEQYDELLENSV